MSALVPSSLRWQLFIPANLVDPAIPCHPQKFEMRPLLRHQCAQFPFTVMIEVAILPLCFPHCD